MSAVRSAAFMAASTGVRLVLGLGTFALMARILGRADFGRLMTAFAAAGLLGVIINFGMSTQALREIGASADPASGRIVMSELMLARLLLAAVVGALALLALPWLPGTWRWLFAAMLLAQFFDAQTDLLNVGFRATGRYSDETYIASISAALQFLVVAVFVWSWRTPLSAACAFAAARFMTMALTWFKQRAYLQDLARPPLRNAIVRLGQARPYAADYGLQALFGQVDSIVIAASFGPAAVGTYQAGMRLLLGLNQAGSVLGNVFIPTLARKFRKHEPMTSPIRKVEYAFLGTGIAGFLVLRHLPGQWISGLLGPDFQDTEKIMPWLALLFLARFTCAAFGIVLTISGQQPVRAKLTALHWLVIGCIALPAMKIFGLIGWPMALVIGNTLLLIAYGSSCHRLKSLRSPLDPLLIAIASLVAAAIGIV